MWNNRIINPKQLLVYANPVIITRFSTMCGQNTTEQLTLRMAIRRQSVLEWNRGVVIDLFTPNINSYF